MAKYMTPELVAEIRRTPLVPPRLDPDRAAKDLDRQVAEEFTVTSPTSATSSSAWSTPTPRTHRRGPRSRRGFVPDRAGDPSGPGGPPEVEPTDRGIDPEPKAVRSVQRVVHRGPPWQGHRDVLHPGPDTPSAWTWWPGRPVMAGKRNRWLGGGTRTRVQATARGGSPSPIVRRWGSLALDPCGRQAMSWPRGRTWRNEMRTGWYCRGEDGYGSIRTVPRRIRSWNV